MSTPRLDPERLGPDFFHTLAEAHGTPFFLYDLDVVRARARLIRDAMGPGARLLYAVKANPCSRVLGVVQQVTDGFDVASRGEIALALRAGASPDRLSFAGPAKTEQDLEAARERGVGTLVVESLRELEWVARTASPDRRARVMLRVCPELRIHAFAVPIGGVPSPFGIDAEALDPVAERTRALADRIDFAGIHAHAGSQCPSAAAFFSHAEHVLAIAARLEREHGLASAAINFGGGFGVAQGARAAELDPFELARRLRPALDGFATARGAPLTPVLELGRWLVADAGLYVTSVVSEKRSRGERFVILDGGINHLLGSSAALGPRDRPPPRISNLSRPEGPTSPLTLVGPLCTPLDVLAAKALVPEPKVGDLIGIGGAGAYGYTMSPLLFLGHDAPAELVLEGGAVQVARARWRAEDGPGLE